MFLLWTVLTWLGLRGVVVVGDVFTSIQEMEYLYQREGRLLDTLQEAIQFHQNKLDIFTRQYAQLIDDRPPSSSPSDYIGHPVNNFVLIRRLTRNWPFILHQIKESFSVPEDLIKEIQLTGEREMESAVRGLVRLQHVYSLDTDLLVNGSVAGVEAVTGLTAADSLEISGWLLERHEFQLTSEWLKAALRRVDQLGDKTVPKEKIVTAIQLVNTLGACDSPHFTPSSPSSHPPHLTAGSTSLTLDGSTADLFRLALSRNCSWLNRNLKLDVTDMAEEWNRNFNKMCSGPEKGPGGLHCHLVHYNNPFLLLAPFKMEEVTLNPPIILVHQAVHESEIEELQRTFLDRMIDCEVIQNGRHVAVSYRMCKRAWMDGRSPMNVGITRRIGQLANLRMEGSEPNQVGCYGQGGEYKLHYDYHPGGGLDTAYGPRLATVMLYLSDVGRGGYTVFPSLNVAVAPVKGSALMWFNTFCDGRVDNRMLHGGCPVLLGAKWVLNKWIHEGGQQCLLRSNDDLFTCSNSLTVSESLFPHKM